MMNDPASPQNPSCCSGSPSCTAALVLGIIALVLALIGFFPCLGWVALIPAGLLAIIALIMSIVAVSKGSPKGALVVSIVAIVLTLAACGAQVWMFSSASAFAEEHRVEIQKCVDDGAKEMPKRGESRRMRQVPDPAVPAAPAAEREETYDTL
ncbi:MAG: hypothetical protein LUE13_00055 [Akkermansiaceae bacterium]|nr:hypothetical protein [Akkermansiaceae bacterium]